MSSATRRLGSAARLSRTAHAWKLYQRAVKAEHAAWQKDIAERACQDWEAFRFHHHARKSQNAWATGLARKHACDSFLAVVCHFTDTFHVESRNEDEAVLRRLIDGVRGCSPALTGEEVAQAVRESKNHKTPGADQVSVELLKYIAQQPDGVPKLTRFYQDIFDRNIFPAQWAQVAVKLLGKTPVPEQPSDLRPIAVHSQVAKVLGRIVLGRVRDSFAPRQPGQTAAKGRQPGDYVWAMQRVCQLAYEWGVPLAAIRIDLAKAFDLISRSRLGRMIVNKLAVSHPQECRCLLAMLLPSDVTIATPWADFTTHSNSGVKQGAVESPILFAAAMEDILAATMQASQEQSWLDTGIRDLSFMDDGFLWDVSVVALQRTLDHLHLQLQPWGLRLNAKKCQLLVWGDTLGRVVYINDNRLEALAPDAPANIMGLPLRPGLGPQDTIHTLIGKARKAFWANHSLLVNSAPLQARLRLFYKTVWGAIAWIIGTTMPNKSTLESLNVFLFQCVLAMKPVKRRPQETYVDHQCRSRRLARYWLFTSGFKRWSTLHLSLTWRYAGHRARSFFSNSPSAASRLTYFRTPHWWARQQQLSTGERHKRRHYPRITLEEAALQAGLEQDWRDVAQDRLQWKLLEQQFVDRTDLPWNSGRQLALPCY